jgi:2-(1,2-epoxy-1,2-dihydrophenyl)acetyl-CoA isomerase
MRAADPRDVPFEGIHVGLEDTVLTIRIDRPHVYNAITVPHLRYIGDACQWAEDAPEVRCIVITGTGSSFCSGADLQSIDLNSVTDLPPVGPEAADLYGPVMQVSKPTIAAVNGAAAGGGFGLTLCCDVRIAAERARFAPAFSRVGVPANDTVPWLLPRLIGLSRTLELLYDTRPVGAADALAMGLVSRVVPDDRLAAETAELAARFAAAPPYAVRLTKRLVLEGLTKSYREFVLLQDYANLANRVAAPGDIAEGVQAFADKRPPRFTGPG